jgi:hypothetical protein
MPTWRKELPPEGKHMGFRLRRTPIGAAIGGIITSENFLVVDTHYWHARTTPCERKTNAQGALIDDSTCAPCQQKIGYRSHVYFAAFNPQHSEHFLYECTCHAAKPIAEYLAAVGTIRGCIFHATRAHASPNGRVTIETHTADLHKISLPPAPNLILALSVIWRLPLTGLAIEHQNSAPECNVDRYATPRDTVRTNPGPLREMREQPDNVPDPPTIAQIIAGNGELREKTIAE